MLHTWSLAVEEQFYMIYPVILIFASRLGGRVLAIFLTFLALVSFVLAEYLSGTSPATAFYLLPSRAWELLIGALSALSLSSERRWELPQYLKEVLSLLGFGAILFGVVTFSRVTPFPGIYALLPVLGAALIILCAWPETWVGKLLGSRILVGLGLISYSTYLWHQTLFAFARNVMIYSPGNAMLLGLSLLSIILGFVSWRYIEAPFRDKAKVKGLYIILLTAILSIGFIAFGLLGHVTSGFEERVDTQVRAIERERLDKRRVREALSGCRTTSLKEGNSCILGEGKLEGAIIGDYHARQLAVPFSSLFLDETGALLISANNGCPPIQNVYRADLGAEHRCFEANQQLFEYILASPDLKFVILTARWTIYYKRKRFDNLEGGDEEGTDVILELTDSAGNKLRHTEEIRKAQLLQQYQSSIQLLLDRGLKVFLIYPTPEVGLDVPKSMAKARFLQNHDLRIDTSYELFKGRNREVLELFDHLPETPNLVKIRPDRLICNIQQGRCSTQFNNRILYADDDHLSYFGSELIAREIGKIIPW